MSETTQPYSFMPLKRNPSEVADECSATTSVSFDTRMSQCNYGSNWCRCSNCGEMPTSLQKKCCFDENFALTNIQSDNFVPERDCVLECKLVTDHVLGDVSIQLSWLKQRQYHGFRGDDLLFDLMHPNEYRYHAYRNYIGIMYGYLGRRNRRVIPACVVSYIRRKWPDPAGVYTGYREVDDSVDELHLVMDEGDC